MFVMKVLQVQSFINRVMKDGKKSTATRVVYNAFDIVGEKTGKEPLEVFQTALKNISPYDGSSPPNVSVVQLIKFLWKLTNAANLLWQLAGSLQQFALAKANLLQTV